MATTTQGFDLYTDHNNLISLFGPLFVIPDLLQTALRKVLRWAIRLSFYMYTCMHIKGDDNVWADLLGRWLASATLRRLVKIPALPSYGADSFEWLTPDKISALQQQHIGQRPTGMAKEHGILCYLDSALWIPDGASDMQLPL